VTVWGRTSFGGEWHWAHYAESTIASPAQDFKGDFAASPPEADRLATPLIAVPDTLRHDARASPPGRPSADGGDGAAQMEGETTMREVTRVAALAATVALVAAALAACGGGKSDAEKANEALQKGIAAHNTGQLDVARNFYLDVLNLDPRNKFAYYNLGLISQTRGDAVDAENNYRIALGIDPDFGAALYNMGILKKDSGLYTEAMDFFRKVLALEPENAAAHYNLGIVLVALGRAQEGQSEISRARTLNAQLGEPGPIATATPGN
jgi:tetratricopeptide (TPR) repeat protein